MLAARTLAGVSTLVYSLAANAAAVLPMLQEQYMQEQALIQQVCVSCTGERKKERGALGGALGVPRQGGSGFVFGGSHRGSMGIYTVAFLLSRSSFCTLHASHANRNRLRRYSLG